MQLDTAAALSKPDHHGVLCLSCAGLVVRETILLSETPLPSDAMCDYLTYVQVHLVQLCAHQGRVNAMYMANVVQAQIVGYKHIPLLSFVNPRQEHLLKVVFSAELFISPGKQEC